MRWKKRPNWDKVVAGYGDKLLRELSIVLNRGLKTRLTWEYLRVVTGKTRQTTNALLSGHELFVGTGTAYGAAYNTGRWDRVKPDRAYSKLYREHLPHMRPSNLIWSGGKRGHRPFIRDTIFNDRTMSELKTRLGRLK